MPIVRNKDDAKEIGWFVVPLGPTIFGVFSEGGKLLAHGFLTRIGAQAWIENNEATFKARIGPG